MTEEITYEPVEVPQEKTEAPKRKRRTRGFSSDPAPSLEEETISTELSDSEEEEIKEVLVEGLPIPQPSESIQASESKTQSKYSPTIRPVLTQPRSQSKRGVKRAANFNL